MATTTMLGAAAAGATSRSTSGATGSRFPSGFRGRDLTLLEGTVRALAKVRGDFGEAGVQLVQLLSLVAAEQPLTQTAIERRLKLSKAAVSRNVLMLGRIIDGQRGPDLVEAVEDPDNRRFKLVRLTPTGEKYVAGLLHLLNGGK